MMGVELSEVAQHWFTVVLIWIGFGTLAGLMAKALFPAREPSGAVTVVTLGIIGSLIGPLTISWLWRGHAPNPIGPLGLLAATASALVLMIVYRLVLRPRRQDAEDSDSSPD